LREANLAVEFAQTKAGGAICIVATGLSYKHRVWRACSSGTTIVAGYLSDDVPI